MSEGLKRLAEALTNRVQFNPAPKPTEWIPENVYLSRKFSAQPGYMSLDLTPYTKEPLDMLLDSSVRIITLCCASQVAKSMTLIGLLSYVVCNCDGQVVYALPTAEACQTFVQNRWRLIGEYSPAVKEQGGFERDNFQIKEQRFHNVTVSWVGSNSANQAAMRSAPFLFLDEVDKMAAATDEESAFYELIQERTKTFPLHKIFEASTPTIEGGNIWKSFLLGDQRYFHVPSYFAPDEPKFVLKFDMVKWDQTARYGSGDWDFNRVRASAYIECPYTKEKITDDQKGWMLSRGEWVPTNLRADITRRSYHLSSLYSRWLTIGDMAVKFLESKGTPEGLSNFRNSWQALPKIIKKKQASATTFEMLIDGSPEYQLRTIPNVGKPPVYLAMTVDVQSSCFFFVVRAYWSTGESALIDYGMLSTWEEVDRVFSEKYPIANSDGKTKSCLIGMVDGGYGAKQGHDVYGFVTGKGKPIRRVKDDWFVSFGRSNTNVTALKVGPVSEDSMVYEGYKISTVFYLDDHWKTNLFVLTLGREGATANTWWLPRNLDFNYKEQLQNENLMYNDDGTTYWQKSGPQHLGDCEKMQQVVEFKAAGLFKR